LITSRIVLLQVSIAKIALIYSEVRMVEKLLELDKLIADYSAASKKAGHILLTGRNA